MPVAGSAFTMNEEEVDYGKLKEVASEGVDKSHPQRLESHLKPAPAGHIHAPRDIVLPGAPFLYLIRVPSLCTTTLVYPDMISSHGYKNLLTETSYEKYPTMILQYRDTYLTLPGKTSVDAELTKL